MYCVSCFVLKCYLEIAWLVVMFIARLVYLNECVQVDFLSWRVRSLKFSEAAVLEFRERGRETELGRERHLLAD